MAITVENNRDTLSRQTFDILCPKCQKPTTPKFTKWEIQLLNEHTDAYVIVECLVCNKTYMYTPATGSFGIS